MALSPKPTGNNDKGTDADRGEKPYVVKNVTEQIKPSMSGKFEPYIVVTYETRRGTIGTVNVPKEKATPDAVKSAIDDAVKQLEAIYNL